MIQKIHPLGSWWDGKRLMQLIAFIAAVVGSAFVLFAPVYSIVTGSSSGSSSGSTSGSTSGHVVETTQTLIDVNGAWVIILAIIPVVVAAFPLLLRGRSRVVATIVAAVILVVFVGISAASIGLFYLVSAMSALVAIFVPGRVVKS